MVYANVASVSGLGGEVSPKIHQRVDLPTFQRAYERIQNFIAELEGTMRYRNGGRFLMYTRRQGEGNLIPFQFTDEQSYLLVITDQKMRFIKDDGIIVESSKPISAITKANPGVVTSTAHGYSDGDEVFLNEVGGMTQLNGRPFVVDNATANTFTLEDVFGNAVDTTNYTTYTSGGIAERVYEIASPYTAAQLFDPQYSQNADTMYLTERTHGPRKLTRSGHTSWTFNTYTRTSDPFTTSSDYPRAVRFYGGRLYFGGTDNAPSRFWGSRGPSSTGAPRYDDFTTGTDDDHAVIFNMNPNDNNGQVDVLQWLSGNDRFLVAGTYSDTQKIYGATEEQPVTPTSISVKPLASVGTAATIPMSDNKAIFYITRSTKAFHSIRYNFVQDGYSSYDHTEIANHLTRSGLKQVIFQRGNPDVLWVLRNDGVLLGLTYKDGEIEPGWHRHVAGGNGAVEAIGQMLRTNKSDQLYMIVRRTIQGQTVRSIEVMTDEAEFFQAEDFYTKGIDEEVYKSIFKNAQYEVQKNSVHLDMSSTYDGSAFATETLTPAAVSGSGVTFTAGGSVFTSDMVGRQIWGRYNVDGTGGGKGTIASYVSGTEITVDIYEDFSSTDAIAASDWFLTATTISGLHHLEGETVQVITDGATHLDQTVTDGAISLAAAASVVHVGFDYVGLLKSMNLEVGGTNGPAQTKTKNVERVDVNMLNSTGVKLGMDLFELEDIPTREVQDEVNRPSPPFTGVKEVKPPNGWEKEKHIYIVQERAQPCIIRALSPAAEVVNE